MEPDVQLGCAQLVDTLGRTGDGHSPRDRPVDSVWTTRRSSAFPHAQRTVDRMWTTLAGCDTPACRRVSRRVAAPFHHVASADGHSATSCTRLVRNLRPGRAAAADEEGRDTAVRVPPVHAVTSADQPATTATSTSAVTSGCSRTVTGCVPTVLIWPGTSTARLSSAGPPAARDGVDDVGRRDRAEEPAGVARGLGLHRDGAALPSSARDLLGVAEVADLRALAGRAGSSRPASRRPGSRRSPAARQQVVAAVAVLDLDDVAGRAQAGHVGGEDELHGPSLLSARSRCRAAGPPRGSSSPRSRRHAGAGCSCR